MFTNRVIPLLLLSDGGLVKTSKFKNPKYVGDPVNVIKIFNDKEVDELILLDINASKPGNDINYHLIEEIAGECFMPLCYGGGINTFEQAQRVFSLGVEKISLNHGLFDNLSLISQIAETYGKQSIVVSIDCRKNFLGKYFVYDYLSDSNTKLNPVIWAKQVEAAGAGEILLTAVDKEGTMSGYDLELIRMVAQEVGIPVIACGGAGTLEHLTEPIKRASASAVSASSLFIYHGKLKAVLINYPARDIENYF